MALYDPNEFPAETKVGADFTLADVLAWARTKPADEEYNFTCANLCAVAQFGLATGRAHLIDVGDLGDIDPILEGVALEGDWTFGEFANRLEKAIASSVAA